MRWTRLTVAGFVAGRKGPQAKEWGCPLAAGNSSQLTARKKTVLSPTTVEKWMLFQRLQ